MVGRGAVALRRGWIGAAMSLAIFAGGSARGDRAADEAAFERIRIAGARPLRLETPLIVGGMPAAAIVPGEGEPWRGAAEALRVGIAARFGVELPLLAAGDVTGRDWETRELIVIGNLESNPVFARLYHNFFACADAAYTGAGGFELRTVHDPWGTGHNAIAIGAQDGAGARAGAERLIAIAGARAGSGDLTLGRLHELRRESEGRRAPLPAPLGAGEIEGEKRRIAAIYARPGTERGAAHATVRFAMRYHRTADPGWLELYRDAIRRHMRYYATDPYILEGGPRRYDRDFRDSWAYGMVIAWDLMEEAPGWEDGERLAITNHILRLVWECNLYQGWDNPRAVEAWRRFDSVTHNHHTWPGLANLFGGWYFTRHHQLGIARDWLEIARGMFRSCARSCKPWEDSAAYQWIPQRHVLMYSLADGDPTFVRDGHAARTGQVALMAIDSLGHQPAWGDHASLDSHSFLPELLSGLEHATGDGRYRWARERLGIDARGEMEEPYWTSARATRPDDLVGVTASALPKPFYDLLGTRGRSDIFPAPNLPLAESFDKVTLRGGWDAGDDYLMLDGTGAGSHGHLDANAIVSYTAAGAHWLVDGEYIRRAQKYHCAVAVIRDGVGAAPPPCARLDHAVWFGDGALVRSSVPGLNGMTWERNLLFVPGGWVTVIDEMIAREPGDYSLRCCWRVLGEAEVRGDTLRVRQEGRGFTLRNVGGQDQELVRVRERVAGYPVWHLYQRRSIRLDAGGRARFVNVFAAAGAGGPPAIDARLGARGEVILTRGGKTELFGVGGRAGAIDTDAALVRVADGEVWVAGATRFACAGREWLRESAPVTARIDPSGVIRGEAAPGSTPGSRVVRIVAGGRRAGAIPGLADEIARAARTRAGGDVGDARVSAVGEEDPTRVLWRFDRFQPSGRVIRDMVFRSDPSPREAYRPLERLGDGKWSGSTGSCLFPAGRRVNLTLDLGRARRVLGVRLRSWESHAGWGLARVTGDLCSDAEGKESRSLGAFPVLGTEAFGTNVGTVRACSPIDGVGRWIRLALEPRSADSAVYLAEIEAIACEEGGHADLVALAGCDLDGDGHDEIVVGTDSGEIVALDREGRVRWKAEVGGSITALAAGAVGSGGETRVIYGTDRAVLGALGSDGARLGEVEPPMYRGIPSRVRTICLADLDGAAAREIVIGCDSWQYMAYRLGGGGAPGRRDAAGWELLWKSVIYAHGATVGHVTDLDGDRAPEIVAGNAYYSLQILDRRGRLVGSDGSFGPEQTAVASGDLGGGIGSRAVVLGTDDGGVLAFDRAGKRLWRADIGDRVTTLAVEGAGVEARVIAASESGFLWALDARGGVAWKRDLGGALRRFVTVDETFACAVSGAGIVRVSRGGEIAPLTGSPRSPLDLARVGDRLMILGADGAVHCVACP